MTNEGAVRVSIATGASRPRREEAGGIDLMRARERTRSPVLRRAIECLRSVKRRAKALLFERLPSASLASLVIAKLPRSAQVEVTTACNLRCPLCATHDVARVEKFLRVDALENLLRGCGSRLKFVNLHLLGEPLMHRGLFGLVRACAKRGVKTSFSSNGMLLDRRLDEVLDSGLSHLSIAIDGVDQADYARYRIGGDLARVVANVKALLARRAERGLAHPIVQVQMVMFSYNEDREEEAKRFLASLGADVVSLKRPSYVGPADARAGAFLAGVDHENATRRFARDLTDESRLYRNRRMCPQLERGMVLSDGRIVACCMDVSGQGEFGNLNHSSFERIWRSRAHREVLDRFTRREFGPCASCTLGDARAP